MDVDMHMLVDADMDTDADVDMNVDVDMNMVMEAALDRRKRHQTQIPGIYTQTRTQGPDMGTRRR
jgi:hypothetical protein